MNSASRSLPGTVDDSPARAPRRGRLAVFLGAARGCGKTASLLAAAGRLQAAGVALCCAAPALQEAAQQAGLPCLPAIERGGVQLPDLQGLLTSPPALVLIGDLAGSNPPGCRHVQHWQDVQELRAAGIDVYATLNIQHLESLNSQVMELTGLYVRDTVPDWLVQEADELHIVDAQPAALLAGTPADDPQALARCTALRGLLLQFAASRADADLQACHRQHGQRAPVVLGRLLVAVGATEDAETLVRHACRVARQRQLPWSLVHVDTGAMLEDTARQYLRSARLLAENLGGEVVSLRGSDVAGVLLQHARDRRASVLLVGASRPRWQRRSWLRRSVTSGLLQQGRGLEISVLDAGRLPTARPLLPRTARHGDYLLALAATLAASLLAWLVSPTLPPSSAALIYLFAVLLIGVRSSLGPALLCAALSFLSYHLLCIPPMFSLHIQRHEDLLTLAFFLVMAILTGNLASRLRRQMDALRDTQAEAFSLLELSRRLGTLTDRPSMLAAFLQQLSGRPELEFCLLGPDEQQVLRCEAGPPVVLDAREQEAADWAWQQGQPCGAGTRTLAGGRWWWLPLTADGRTLALLGGCSRPGARFSTGQRRRLQALGQLLAQALARASLTHELEETRLCAETERLRSALLSSVSHDLRTPLTVMHGAIDSLLSFGEQLDAADRRELLESTRNEAGRLDRYIQNLLDMTRLDRGELQPVRDWTAPADMLAAALTRLQPLLAPLQLELQLPDELPLLYVHGELVEQALINVLENAARFSPPGGRLQLLLECVGDELRISVSDEGPGIPPAERARIFDMFYTAARGDRGGKGTGLGLAICQGIVTAHGGRVTVGDGLSGSGTCMTLHLPLHHQPPYADNDPEGA